MFDPDLFNALIYQPQMNNLRCLWLPLHRYHMLALDTTFENSEWPLPSLDPGTAARVGLPVAGLVDPSNWRPCKLL